MLSHKVKGLLGQTSFIHIASCDFDNNPNAAVKLVLKVEGNFVYLADYTEGKTYQNLKINPIASLSFDNRDTLSGFQINGPVEIIDKGAEYDIICSELHKKELNLSAERIIKAVSEGKVTKDFEINANKKVVIFKVKIESVAEFKYTGEIIREAIKDL